MGIKRETEKSFMATVVQFAKLHGWLVYHTHDSRKSEPGFPDLVLVRTTEGNRRVLFAELKMDGNRLTDEQAKWMTAITLAGVRAVLWRPDDWDEIEGILRG